MTTAMLAVGVALGVAAAAASAQEPVINQTEVALVGCIENEKAYRTRTGGETIGLSQSDMVLTQSKAAPGSTTPVDLGGDFVLTGRLESQLSTEVGRPVEIVGFVEDLATHDAAMNPTAVRRLFVRLWQPAAGVCS
jgi:hypothetical protein